MSQGRPSENVLRQVRLNVQKLVRDTIRLKCPPTLRPAKKSEDEDKDPRLPAPKPSYWTLADGLHPDNNVWGHSVRPLHLTASNQMVYACVQELCLVFPSSAPNSIGL